jgi:hypothetical protein
MAMSRLPPKPCLAMFTISARMVLLPDIDPVGGSEFLAGLFLRAFDKQAHEAGAIGGDDRNQSQRRSP